MPKSRLRKHPEPSRDVQELTGREDSSAVQAWTEDAKFAKGQGVIIDRAVDAGARETWIRTNGTAGGCGTRGNSKIHHPKGPTERRSGATRKFTESTGGRCNIRADRKTGHEA
jgi:hypothetical protein